MPHALDAGRARGALLGLALGDALGTTLEFSTRDAKPPLTDLVGGGPFSLPAGCWTDDTSMALCLAESLIEGWNPADQARRYLRWWREGYNSATGRCFDIGVTTSQALSRFARSGEPFSGTAAVDSAGNGSIMRLCPIAIRFCPQPDLLDSRAADSSRVTHGSPEAVDACRFLAGRIAAALRGGSREDVLAPFEFDGEPSIARIAAGIYRGKPREQIRSSGYVASTLEAALWCFAQASDFRHGALMAANLGHDADTVAAVYGQIAGACWGEHSLPADWLERLAWRDKIAALADALVAAAGEDAEPARR